MVQHNKVVKFGIVGTGSISGHHARSIREIENAELVAVCSTSPDRAKIASSKFGVPAYYNLRKLLSSEQLDALCICTESGNHLLSGSLGAMAGKHILVEKPLEINLERAIKLIKICKKNDVKLGIVFQNRFNPNFQKLKQAVNGGHLGKIFLANAKINWFRESSYYANSNWKGTLKGDGGAALINQGIHTIDLLLDLMDAPISIYGKSQTVLHEIEGEDLAVAILKFKDDAVGIVECSTALYPGYNERLEIFGENGSIIYEGGEIISWNVKGLELEISVDKINGSSGASRPLDIDYRFHKLQIHDFVESIINERTPLVTGQDALKSLSAIEAIYQSSMQNREIKLK